MDTIYISRKVLKGINIPEVPPLATREFRIKYLGLIFGNALGDAIGLRTEFLLSKYAHQIWGSEELSLGNWPDCNRGFPQGDWTDDTDQLILIIQSFIDNSSIIPSDFARRLLDWKNYGIPEFGDKCGMGIGQLVYSVISNPDFIQNSFNCALSSWIGSQFNAAPNGAVMRTSILGAINYQDLTQVIKQTIEIATVTHVDPRSVASCVALTSAISLMLQGHRWEDAYELAIRISKVFIRVYTEEMRNVLETLDDQNVLEQFDEGIEKFEESKLEDFLRGDFNSFGDIDGDTMGFTYFCIGCGFWAFRQDNWETAIREIVLRGGDADTNAAVAGAILGCKLGYSDLPNRIVDQLRYKKWLEEKSDILFNMIR